jgi:3-deoxy-D-manno-octulosonate 8-phosphate phosphatase (KDO 8-P phosphatase)
MLDATSAKRIRLLGLDVDGVLTDNGVYIGAVGDEVVEYKRFDIQDGLGIAMLRGSGLEVALVSGRVSAATSARARELGIDEVLQDAGARKIPAFQALLDRRGLSWEEVAFVGDDLADLPVFQRVGLPVAVANAVPELRALAAYVTTASGGHGAVREVIERLLQARGEWEETVRRFLEARDALDSGPVLGS